MSDFNFEAFVNRLRKMDRHYSKWARRQGISCFRIYDADMAEFPLAVDRYEQVLHVAEYKRDHHLDEEEYRAWRAGSRLALHEALDVPMERIFFKEREQQKGKRQYEKRAERKHEMKVQEGGLSFWVNLSDYLDTGLFLDHRITRQLVRERSEGKRLLNLFAYTGSFSVYAAAGGAVSTTTIDLSNTYLEWAQRNMALNGFEGPEHRFLREDAVKWLQMPPAERYDIIVLDPPTFSNSKSMFDVLDVQRDHPMLINQCLARLAPGGVLFFSTNYRKFQIEPGFIYSTAHIRDISGQTIPPDFRNKKIHYCFEITQPG